jgi:hypothetical protein
MPACADDVDADGFTKVASKIRYRAPAPAKAGRKNRKGRAAAPAVPAASGDAAEEDEPTRLAKLRENIEGRRKMLEFGSWAESWEGELRLAARPARLRRALRRKLADRAACAVSPHPEPTGRPDLPKPDKYRLLWSGLTRSVAYRSAAAAADARPRRALQGKSLPLMSLGTLERHLSDC